MLSYLCRELEHKNCVMKQDKIIELYRGELWECQLLETVLKDEGIDCFLTNSVRSGYGPIIAFAQQIQVMIKESDAEKGLAVLDTFKKGKQ
jgi:hypothetical protein